MSKKTKLGADRKRFQEQLDARNAQVAEFQQRLNSLLKPAKLVDEIWRQGLKVRLEGTALHGKRVFAEAMFCKGYRHAAEHFLKALRGDSASLERVLLNEEVIHVDDDVWLETVRGEDAPQC